MGVGTYVRAIWTNLSGTTSPNVQNLVNNLFQQLEGAKAGYGSVGNIFFVHGLAGNNANSGLVPAAPFLTITHALTQCVADHDDYIIVLDHWQEVVAINVTRVHIIGVTKNATQAFVQMNAAADTAIFTVTALSNHCEIAGFSFGGGATHAAIENQGGTPMQLHIHDCLFGHFFAGQTPQDGIDIELNATNIRIERCTFYGNGAGTTGTITRDGIRFVGGGDTLGGCIRDCRFLNIPGVGINVTTRFDNGFIEDNRFQVPDGAIGEAITFAAAAAGNCLVDGNRAAAGGDAVLTNNPFRDLSGAPAASGNDWGQNFSGAAAAALPSAV